MNAQAQAALEPAVLPAFFSTYHAVVSLSVIVVQTMLARSALDTLGIGLLMGSSSLVMAAGSLVALAVPGLMAVTATYGLNSVVHQSLFRQAYEQFFTSVPSSEQRTFKPIADSFFNRLGAAGGAGLIALLTLLAPARVYPGLLVAAVLCAAGAVLLAGPMNRICISTLERGLLRRALELDLDERRGHLDADRRTPPALRDAVALNLDERAGAHFLAAASPGTTWSRRNRRSVREARETIATISGVVGVGDAAFLLKCSDSSRTWPLITTPGVRSASRRSSA